MIFYRLLLLLHNNLANKKKNRIFFIISEVLNLPVFYGWICGRLYSVLFILLFFQILSVVTREIYWLYCEVCLYFFSVRTIFSSSEIIVDSGCSFRASGRKFCLVCGHLFYSSCSVF